MSAHYVKTSCDQKQFVLEIGVVWTYNVYIWTGNNIDILLMKRSTLNQEVTVTSFFGFCLIVLYSASSVVVRVLYFFCDIIFFFHTFYLFIIKNHW